MKNTSQLSSCLSVTACLITIFSFLTGIQTLAHLKIVLPFEIGLPVTGSGWGIILSSVILIYGVWTAISIFWLSKSLDEPALTTLKSIFLLCIYLMSTFIIIDAFFGLEEFINHLKKDKTDGFFLKILFSMLIFLFIPIISVAFFLDNICPRCGKYSFEKIEDSYLGTDEIPYLFDGKKQIKLRRNYRTEKKCNQCGYSKRKKYET